MKTKYALIAAVLLAAATVTSVKSFKETTSLLDANVEALADGENVNSSICYSEYNFHLIKRVLVCVECTYKWGYGTKIGGFCQ